mgnify:FL=1
MRGRAGLRVLYTLPNDATVTFGASVTGGNPAPTLTLALEMLNSQGVFVEVARQSFGVVPVGENRSFTATFTPALLQSFLGFVGNHVVRGRMTLANTIGSIDVLSNQAPFTVNQPPAPSLLPIVNPDFELAGLSGWSPFSTGLSTVFADNLNPRGGLLSMGVSILDGASAFGNQFVGSRNNIYARVYFRLNLWTPVQHHCPIFELMSDELDLVVVGFTGGRNLHIWYRAGGVNFIGLQSSYVIPFNQWLCIELSRTRDVLTGSISVLVNGVQVLSLTNLDTGDFPVNRILLGNNGRVMNSGQASYNIDDVAASETGPVGC